MKNSQRDLELEKQIDAYVKGHLTQEEAEQLWVKLFKNPEYIDLLETEIHVKSIVEREPLKSQPKTPVQFTFFKRSWQWVAAAAVTGILITVLSLLGSEDEGVETLALSSISMIEHLASPDILRAENSNLSNGDSLLNLGFNQSISGKPAQGLQIYEKVISNHPDNVKVVAQAYYNIGIIHFNANRYSDASEAFQNALQRTEEDRILEEKALWFLANTYIHLNQLGRARDAITGVYGMDGIYRKQASRLINRLDQQTDENSQ